MGDHRGESMERGLDTDRQTKREREIEREIERNGKNKRSRCEKSRKER